MKLDILMDPYKYEDEILAIEGVIYGFNDKTSKSSKSENQKFEKTIGFKIPDEMLDLYNQNKSINLFWTYKKDGIGLINGGSWLHGSYSFNRGYFNARRSKKKGQKLKDLLWVDGMDVEWTTHLEKKYFILDFICFYSNTFVLLNFSEDSPKKPELTLFMYPNLLFPLQLTFKEYIYWIDKTRSMNTWMEHFIDKEKCTDQALQYLKTIRSGRFFSNMSTVFPNIKLEKFPGDHTIEPNYSFTTLAVKKDYFNRLIEISEKFYQDKPVQSLHKIDAEISTQKYPLIELRHNPLNIYMVRKIERSIQRKLPDSMLAFYGQLNGFSMDWSIPNTSEFSKNYETEDQNYLFANFTLYGLQEVFGGPNSIDMFHWDTDNWPGAVSDPENMSEDELLFANKCFLIYGSELNNVVIRFEENQEEPDLYLCEYINESFFHKLNITFTEFIELLFENMGIQYWVRFFIEDKTDAMQIAGRSPNIPRILNKLCPQTDLTKYYKIKST